MKRITLIIFIGSIFFKSIAQDNKQLFNFEPDLRIFTAYAFLNACGFDHDWLKMDTIRILTRNYVDSILQNDFKQEIRNFSNRTSLAWYECGAYALNLDGAPTFKWVCDTCDIDLKNKFLGLDILFRQFYEKAKIEILWTRYKATFDSINYSYQPYAQRAINDITSFLKIDKDYYLKYSGSIHFLICPLMSHWTAFNHKANNILYLVQGPSQGEAGPDAFYHEALHPPIGPVIDKYKDLAKNFNKLYDYAQQQLQGNYPSMIAILNESFVRTIDRFLVGQYYKLDNDRTRKIVEDEYRLGFIFCLYIYENIPKYLDSNKSFEDYYPILMTNLDVNKEIERWINFHKNDKE